MIRFDKNEVFLLPADESGRGKMKEYLEFKHGSLNVGTAARSILSRQIETYAIGNGARTVFVCAGHHALESITVNFAFLLIDTLLAFSRGGMLNGKDCKLLLSKYRFIITPCVNPDGIELRLAGVGDSPLKDRQNKMSGGDFSRWQANSRGVDLNHNYNFRFAEYKALERERGIAAGASLYSGEYPESEPESRGIANLVRILMPEAVVSLHSQGEEIYGYPETAKVKRYLRRLSASTGYTVASATDTAAYGGLCDYTGSIGIPSFTFEIGRGKNPLSESELFGIFKRTAEGIILLPTIL